MWMLLLMRTDKRYDMKNIVEGAFRSLIKIKKGKGMNKAFLLFKYSLFSIKIRIFLCDSFQFHIFYMIIN